MAGLWDGLSENIVSARQYVRSIALPVVRRHRNAVIFWLLLVCGVSALTAASDIIRDWGAGEAAVSRIVFREALSAALILAFIPLIAWLDGAMIRKAAPLWMTVMAHTAFAAIYTPLRPIVLSILYMLPDVLAGARYDFGYIASRSLQEVPKELIVYGLIVVLLRVFPRLALQAAPTRSRTLTFRNGARLVSLVADKIEQVSAAGNYVEVSTGAKVILHRSTLSQLEQRLPKEQFFRVQRSSIVNLDSVCSIDPDGPRDSAVTLQSGKRIRIARDLRRDLVEALEKRHGS